MSFRAGCSEELALLGELAGLDEQTSPDELTCVDELTCAILSPGVEKKSPFPRLSIPYLYPSV